MITLLRRLGFLLALASGLFCSIVIVEGVGRTSRSDLEIMVYLALLIAIYNCFTYFIFEIKPDSENGERQASIISLWLKRKRLEEQKRIRELEK